MSLSDVNGVFIIGKHNQQPLRVRCDVYLARGSTCVDDDVGLDVRTKETRLTELDRHPKFDSGSQLNNSPLKTPMQASSVSKHGSIHTCKRRKQNMGGVHVGLEWQRKKTKKAQDA
jgi:hypothetical protein